MQPVMITSKTAAPSPEDVAAITNTIYNAKTSQESLDAAYALTDSLLNSVGFRGLAAYNLLPEISKAATDKKVAGKREGAMFAIGAIWERFPPKARLSEIVFLMQESSIVATVLDSLADRQSPVKEGAQYALDALYGHLSAEMKVFAFLPVLVSYLRKKTGKWQGTVGAMTLLGKMADDAKMGMESRDVEEGKDVLREAMGRKLAELIPIVEAGMHDLKGEVSKSAIKTMNSLTTLLQNDDIAPRIPFLVKSIEDPSAEAQRKAIHALSQTTFVTIVTSPVLALLTPLLERALNTPTTPQEVLRQTVVVVENLTKLVHDPVEARAFLPKLKPGVQAVRDRASLPEVREIGQRAYDVILKAIGESEAGTPANTHTVERTKPEDVLSVVEQEVGKNGGFINYPGDADVWAHAKLFISNAVAEDVNQRLVDRLTKNLVPYLQPLMDDGKADAVGAAVKEFYVAEDNRKYGAPVKEDDGETEIVNANFSLGYGGMLLLSHTNLRLLKGHRYGLCGRNGAGKSTLMRSIANGKLDGFPPQDVVRTCFVEHNQG